jgi:hypothetical protein
MSTKNSFTKGVGFSKGAVVTMIGDAASGDSQCTRSADSAEAQSDPLFLANSKFDLFQSKIPTSWQQRCTATGTHN